MANKMLIDAAHPEETRVVTVKGPRVEEFDFEAANRRQLRGNIYLARVTRVEPSLQAAFIEYGGNRHGFLAFSEIHPDYYQIPIADRQALLAEEASADWEAEESQEERGSRRRRGRSRDRGGERGERAHRAGRDATVSGPAEDGEATGSVEDVGDQLPLVSGPLAEAAPTAEEAEAGETMSAGAAETAAEAGPETAPETAPEIAPEPAPETMADETAPAEAVQDVEAAAGEVPPIPEAAAAAEVDAALAGASPETAPETRADAGEDAPAADARGEDESQGETEDGPEDDEDDHDEAGDEDGDENGDEPAEEHHVVEQVGGRGDALAEIPERPRHHRRQYKIQEVIKRRQVLLVQVVKEERGTKGAALTTYLSLAGRYSVLMPNTGKGGGISRKITSAADRKRLKEIVGDLEVPEGMGVILRTAGAARTKPEIKRDFEYLLRLWESVRELTLSSTAPALVYEEGSLIKRAIRDLYNKEIDEILVAGEEAYREAKDFMRMLMPTNTKVVKAYREPQPLFAKNGVEAQLDAMFSNHVSLKSGGYLVINPTEALVSIDVNSGRSTREHNIEDTALRTNLEAAEEVSRQLRLRDLAGLIVIDFIDMEEKRNNRAVEKKLNDCLKNDRARIQVGRISPFGLLEMSRQRIRTGVLESSSIPCPHCAGSGFMRATSSIALHILRTIEEALIKSATHNLVLRTRTDVALYVLNHKRAHLRDLEVRFGVVIAIAADESLTGTVVFALDRTEPAPPRVETRAPVTGVSVALPPVDEDEEDDVAEEGEESGEDEEETGAEPAARADGEGEGTEGEGDGRGRRRRRRRRRSGRADEGGETRSAEAGEDEAGEEGSAGEAEAPRADGEEGREEARTEAGREGGRDGERRDRGERGDRDGGRRRRGRRGGRGRERDEQDGERAARAEGSSQASSNASSSEPSEDDAAAGTAEAGRPAAPNGAEPRPAFATAPGVSEVEALPDAAPASAAPDPAVNGTASVEAVPTAAAAPEPVAVVLTPSDPDRPKRGGWWSRTKAALTGE